MIRGEERMKVLKMVESGKITAAEATQLLEALDEAPTTAKNAPPPPPPPPASMGGRWFRVRVTDSDTGKVRVNVRLPVGVVSAGLKMGMRFAPQVEGLDLDTLNVMINSGEVGQIVDVMDEKDGEHVEVFIE
jgi:hypothetical protein